MFEVGVRNESTPEFTIYRTSEGYLVELDGEPLGTEATVEAAHRFIKGYCRGDRLLAAGVTEAFGRNRQFITTNRFALKTYKGDTND